MDTPDPAPPAAMPIATRGIANPRAHWLAAAFCVMLPAWIMAHYPLAVTEAMTDASILLGTNVIAPQSDFFELHNYGDRPIDLSNFLFSDRNAVFPAGADSNAFPGIIIRPGETIIFLRPGKTTTNENHFRQIWGETNLPAGLRIYFYPAGYGLDDQGDSVIIGDPQGNIVCRADFDTARMGYTFTFHPETGLFGAVSDPTAPGVQKAAQTDDYGSPGRVLGGPFPLKVLAMSPSQEVDAGTPVLQLNILAAGLPPPSIQWRHNGVILPGAVQATLSLTNVLPEQAGSYDVILDNGSDYGLEQIISTGLVLTVNTQSTPPRIGFLQTTWNPARPELGSNCVTIYRGQNVNLPALVRGFESPSLQWSFRPFRASAPTNLMDGNLEIGSNNVVISGTTGSTLRIINAQAEQSGAYFLTAANRSGIATGMVYLVVGNKPRLFITEVMAQNCTNSAGDKTWNWWELTNLDTIPYNLRGWRWDDWPGAIGAGPTITNDLIIQPGESIIFVEGLTRQPFILWWGEHNLPKNLQVITYYANGLGATGEELTVWNGAAEVIPDAVAVVSWSTATPGASFWFIPGHPCGQYGLVSTKGAFGAFQAANGCDIGSPGWYRPVHGSPVRPREPIAVSIGPDPAGVRLSWNAEPGAVYQVEFIPAIQGAPSVTNYHVGNWQVLGVLTNSSNAEVLTLTDTAAPKNSLRIYQVLVTPEIGCE